MANPPITIGPFNNVPAPGSPIASAWPQSITNMVVGNMFLPNQIGALANAYGKLNLKAQQVTVGTNASGDAQIGFPSSADAPAFTNPPIVMVTLVNPPTAAGLVLGIYNITTGTFMVHAAVPNTGAPYASQSLTVAYLAIARR